VILVSVFGGLLFVGLLSVGIACCCRPKVVNNFKDYDDDPFDDDDDSSAAHTAQSGGGQGARPCTEATPMFGMPSQQYQQHQQHGYPRPDPAYQEEKPGMRLP
jgi:hypothetical protein